MPVSDRQRISPYGRLHIQTALAAGRCEYAFDPRRCGLFQVFNVSAPFVAALGLRLDIADHSRAICIRAGGEAKRDGEHPHH